MGDVKQSEAPRKDLEFDMALQQASQKLVDKYEGQLAKQREQFQIELDNVVRSLTQDSNNKPRRRPLFSFGRKHTSIYLVFNHNTPVYCHLKECPTRRQGFKHGLEVATFSLDAAQEAIETYWKANRGNTAAFIKLLEVPIDAPTTEARKELMISEDDWFASEKLKELLYAVPGAGDDANASISESVGDE